MLLAALASHFLGPCTEDRIPMFLATTNHLSEYGHPTFFYTVTTDLHFLDGVVDVGIVRSLTLTMILLVLLELVVGLCGGIMASSGKMAAA